MDKNGLIAVSLQKSVMCFYRVKCAFILSINSDHDFEIQLHMMTGACYTLSEQTPHDHKSCQQ